MKRIFFVFALMVIATSSEYFVRIAEITVDPKYLQEYKVLLSEGVRDSMRLEKGVILLYPVFNQQKPNYLYVLEIYANKRAYQNHLKTKHFLRYKEKTQHMVLELKLVDVDPIVSLNQKDKEQ